MLFLGKRYLPLDASSNLENQINKYTYDSWNLSEYNMHSSHFVANKYGNQNINYFNEYYIFFYPIILVPTYTDNFLD